MRERAPTLWAAIEPLLAYEPEPVAPRQPWSFSGASLWPVGLILMLVVNLARLCGPSGHAPSRSVPNPDAQTLVSESERARDKASEGSPPAPAHEHHAVPKDAPELRRDGSWIAIQLSLAAGDCEGVRLQWPSYMVSSARSRVDPREERTRRDEVLGMCAELKDVVDPEQ